VIASRQITGRRGGRLEGDIVLDVTPADEENPSVSIG
jgi:hypothetical protein